MSKSTHTDTDAEKQKYLSQDDYYRLVTCEQDYNDGIIQADSTRYREMKNFRSKLSKKKKNGKTL